MSYKPDGGAAFPTTETAWNSDREEWEIGSHGGMTLRDYFAAKVLLAGMTGATGFGDMPVAECRLLLDRVADFTYEVADSMLRARAK
jgi:hypothetical protein